MAKIQTKTPCAYCGQPLDLVAGFCSICHAPAMVARRQLLVAQSKRLERPVIPAQQQLLLTGSIRSPETETMPSWFLIMTIISIITLSASILIMVTRASPHLLQTMTPPNGNSLAITDGHGQKITTGHIGSAITVTYTANVKEKNAAITLSISLQQGTPHVYSTQWGTGNHQDHLSFVPLVGGNWVFSFAINGNILQTIILPVQSS